MKKGTIAWQYIVAIILSLMVLILIIIFATGLRDKIIPAITDFGKWGFGR